MAFWAVDYFCVDSLFSEQELTVRQTVRPFAAERILPVLRDHFRELRFRSQLLAVCVPNCDVYDCAGNRSLTFAALFELPGFVEPPTSESGSSGVQVL
jgi:hypothetical protein